MESPVCSALVVSNIPSCAATGVGVVVWVGYGDITAEGVGDVGAVAGDGAGVWVGAKVGVAVSSGVGMGAALFITLISLIMPSWILKSNLTALKIYPSKVEAWRRKYSPAGSVKEASPD